VPNSNVYQTFLHNEGMTFQSRYKSKLTLKCVSVYPSLARGHNGLAHRRNANHLAQEIARARLTPWLEGEARFAEEKFRETAKRFVELANEFLHRPGEADVPGLKGLPEELGREQSLQGKCGCACFSFGIDLRSCAGRSWLTERDRPRCARISRSLARSQQLESAK